MLAALPFLIALLMALLCLSVDGLLLLKRAGFSIRQTSVTMRQRRTGRSSIPFVRGIYYLMKVSLCLLLDTLRDPWPEGKVLRERTENKLQREAASATSPAITPANPEQIEAA